MKEIASSGSKQGLQNPQLNTQPKHFVLVYPKGSWYKLSDLGYDQHTPLSVYNDLQSWGDLLSKLRSIEPNDTFALFVVCGIVMLDNLHTLNNVITERQLQCTAIGIYNFDLLIRTLTHTEVEEHVNSLLLSLLKGVRKMCVSGIKSELHFKCMSDILDQLECNELKISICDLPNIEKTQGYLKSFISNNKYLTKLDISEIIPQRKHYDIDDDDFYESENDIASKVIIAGCLANPKLEVKYCNQPIISSSLGDFSKERVELNLKLLLPVFKCLNHFGLSKVILHIIQDYSTLLMRKIADYFQNDGMHITPLLEWEHPEDDVPLSGAEKIEDNPETSFIV